MKIEYKNIAKPQNELEALQCCERIVRSRAIKMSKGNPGLYEDLIQQGNMAVLESYARFDKERDIKFVTYAFMNVLHHCQQFTYPQWELYNKCTEFDINKHDESEYYIDTNKIDTLKTLNKFDETHQEVFALKLEGETFDGIAKRLPNVRNLQHARKMYLAVEKKLQA